MNPASTPVPGERYLVTNLPPKLSVLARLQNSEHGEMLPITSTANSLHTVRGFHIADCWVDDSFCLWLRMLRKPVYNIEGGIIHKVDVNYNSLDRLPTNQSSKIYLHRHWTSQVLRRNTQHQLMYLPTCCDVSFFATFKAIDNVQRIVNRW